MIIDCHSHHVETNTLSNARYWFVGEPEGTVSIERFAAHAAAQPVDHMIISATSPGMTTPEVLTHRNALVAELARRYPRRISGLCQVNPHFVDVSLAEMDRHIRCGPLIGIGELCQFELGYETDDPRMFPLIEKAIELDVPVLMHSSSEPHSRGVDRLAARFPEARFILAHMGGRMNWPKGLAVARRHDNVWVDTSGYVMTCPGAMERALDELGSGKILFGVDFPLVSAAPLITVLDQLGLGDDDYERIAFRNTVEVFKLDLSAIGASSAETPAKDVSARRSREQGGERC